MHVKHVGDIKSLENSRAILQEESARMFLWGEGFEEIDLTLSLFDDTRKAVLESLIEVGNIIRRSAFPWRNKCVMTDNLVQLI